MLNEKPGYRQLRTSGSSPQPALASSREPLFPDFLGAQSTQDKGSLCVSEENKAPCLDGHGMEQPALNVINGVSSKGCRENQEMSGPITVNCAEPLNRGDATNVRSSEQNDRSPAPFRWRGQNYLLKMAHDLEFLDDPNVSAPVSAWLGFLVTENPFIIPPHDHDVCKALRREHTVFREAVASRRRHQQQRKDSNGHRRSRSRASCKIGICDAEKYPSSFAFCRKSAPQFVGLCIDSDSAKLEVTVTKTTLHGLEPSNQLKISGPEECTKIKIGCRGLIEPKTAETSAGSVLTSAGSVLQGLGELEEDIACCELSSGEEGEAAWGGGGLLESPIVPPLPESIRRKASIAGVVLCRERASEAMLESRALEMAINAKRTNEILRERCKERSSRLESLTLKSFKEGMRDTLRDRHTCTISLMSASSIRLSESGKEPLKRASTAPANGRNEGRDPIFNTRGGVRVCADGRVADVVVNESGHGTNGSWDAGEINLMERAGVVPFPYFVPAGVRSRDKSRYFPSAISSHLSHSNPSIREPSCLSSLDATRTKGTSVQASVERSAEPSTATCSLRASSSNMSTRARENKLANRRTATRQMRRKGWKIIIPDPAKIFETRELAASRIQTVFLGMCARFSMRKKQEKRTWAATTISRAWRGWRVRVALSMKNLLKKAEEMRQRVEDKRRNRKAHLITLFFRDILYRRRRVR